MEKIDGHCRDHSTQAEKRTHEKMNSNHTLGAHSGSLKFEKWEQMTQKCNFRQAFSFMTRGFREGKFLGSQKKIRSRNKEEDIKFDNDTSAVLEERLLMSLCFLCLAYITSSKSNQLLFP